MRKMGIAALLAAFFASGVRAADWPMYRADATRSGYTPEDLPARLSLRWRFEAPHAPRPAWPRSERMTFDRACQVAVANGTVYFGSSADDRVYALDAAAGQQRWTFRTDAPVRFSPAVWQDHVFVVSDDGFLYCLAAADGELIWKKRSGPDGRMVLGNGRMVSRWCVRGGPAIADGVVYYAAGIWPTDGIFIYALDAQTGAVLWCNEKAGSMELDQPHGGARAKSGVAAQGYLVVAGDHVFVPTGRAIPAAFSRTDGTFQYFHLQKYGHFGAAHAAVIGSHLFNGNCIFNVEDGEAITRGIKACGVAGPPGRTGEIVYSTHQGIGALDRESPCAEKEEERRGKKVKVLIPNPKWTIEAPDCGDISLIQAGKTVISAGPRKVTAINVESRSVTWTTQVDGEPRGLAVADGRLYVSTDSGTIHCFDGHHSGRAKVIRAKSKRPSDDEDPVYAAAAGEIIKRTGITEGFCLDLGCGNGQLACELARRTKLQIHAIDPDARNVTAAREKLDAARLYGVRVTVHQGDPAATPYPDYFANLIVSGRSVTQGAQSVPAAEMLRMQRPYGGATCIGKPGSMKVNLRGPLEGTGKWTHQYCDASNTCCSADAMAKGPLEMLWFDSPDLRTPNRHGRSPAPLFKDGRLFVEGLDAIRAVDAYNGRVLWESRVPGIGRPYHQEHLMGVAGTNSNFCVAADSVYVRTGGRCIRIDAATGKQLAEFKAPNQPDGKPGTWGYVACVDGVLFGTLANREHVVPYRYGKADMQEQFTESLALFAMDAMSRKFKWSYVAEESIRHNAIAIGGGRVYLIDRALAVEVERGKKPAESHPHPTGELLALDAETGTVVWRESEDIYGTMLALSEPHDALLMSYQATRFRLSSELGGRFTVFRASNGHRLWDREIDYRSRPVINDRTVYAEPGAYDLLTGDPLRRLSSTADNQEPWQFTRSYGCGIISGSRNLLLFRSATLGYVDLLRNAGTENFGGIRPGCWINALPVGGLVLLPDTTNVCTCSYLNKASIALQPME